MYYKCELGLSVFISIDLEKKRWNKYAKSKAHKQLLQWLTWHFGGFGLFKKHSTFFSVCFVFCQQSVFSVCDVFEDIFCGVGAAEQCSGIIALMSLFHFTVVINHAEQSQGIFSVLDLNYWTGKVPAGWRWRTGRILYTTLDANLLCSLPSLAGIGNRIFSEIRERGGSWAAKFPPPPTGFLYGET